MIATYILILWMYSWKTGMAMASVEFTTKEACVAAGKSVNLANAGGYVCVWKGDTGE